jgi:hypothetical protein
MERVRDRGGSFGNRLHLIGAEGERLFDIDRQPARGSGLDQRQADVGGGGDHDRLRLGHRGQRPADPLGMRQETSRDEAPSACRLS